MPEKKWNAADIGPTLMEGGAEQTGTSFRMSGAGRGIENDSIFLLSRGLSGSAEIGGKIGEFTRFGEEQAGLVLRQNSAPGSKYAAVYIQGSGLHFRVRADNTQDSRVVATVSSRLVSWLKLTRVGRNVVASYVTPDGEWEKIGSEVVDFTSDPIGGFFVASGDISANFASARFTDYFLQQVSITGSFAQPLTVPKVINLSATTMIEPLTNATITYRAGEMELATLDEPWNFSWTNLTVGSFPITAVLNSPLGMLTSAPVSLTFYEPYTGVWNAGTDLTTLGNWSGEYGDQGVMIPGVLTNLGPVIGVSVGVGSSAFFEYSTNLAALEQGSSNRVASVYRGNPDLELTLVAGDEELYQGALYFVDWLQLGRSQRVTLEGPDGVPGAAIEVEADPASYLKFAFRKSVTVRIENQNGDAYVSAIFVDSSGPTPVLESYLNGTTLIFKVLQPTATTQEELVLEYSSDLQSWNIDANAEFSQSPSDLREFTATKAIGESGGLFFRVRVGQ